MFCSLDSVDIVYTHPDGRERWMQTDHRPPAEVEAEPELSVLFALIRLLNPRRDLDPELPEPVLEYRCQHAPPEFLRAAIAGGRGELIVGERADVLADEVVAYEREAPDPETLADLAFAALARRIASERDLAFDLFGLDRLEQSLPRVALATDEVQYWRAVVQLAAFAGEALRAVVGGHWRLVDNPGTLPFLFLVDPADAPTTTAPTTTEPTTTEPTTTEPIKVNLLGKAIRRLEGGPGNTLLPMVGAAISAAQNPRG